jgi:hypothetical protein
MNTDCERSFFGSVGVPELGSQFTVQVEYGYGE